MPERSDALKKAQQKYMEKFSVARVRMERDRYERVQAHAVARGESTNAFIGRAITETMERDSAPQEAAGTALEAGVVSLPPDTLKAAQEGAQAAGEGLPQFIARAVETQMEQDKMKGGEPNEYRELCVSMLDSFTESQLGNVAAMLQTMKKAIEDAMSGDVPNAETVEAMTEVDAMIASGTGEHFTGTTADFFQQLAEG